MVRLGLPASRRHAPTFSNPSGGFFDTRVSQEGLILRPQDFQITPPKRKCPGSLCLIQLSSYTGRMDWKEKAQQMLVKISASAIRYPTAFSYWLCAEDFGVNPVHEVAIIGDSANFSTQAWSTCSGHHTDQI